MNASTREILVLPRQLFSPSDRFIHADDTNELFSQWESRVEWMPRAIAETCVDRIQLIPCVLIESADEHFYVFRRTQKTRDDLKGRLSFLVGGHVDGPPTNNELRVILEETLRREVEEELGVTELPQLHLLGLVTDYSTITSSRHVGVVFKAILHGRLTTQAPEEFSARSEWSGKAFGLDKLREVKARQDPWSSILYEEYLIPRYRPEQSFQRTMPLLLSEKGYHRPFPGLPTK